MREGSSSCNARGVIGARATSRGSRTDLVQFKSAFHSEGPFLLAGLSVLQATLLLSGLVAPYRAILRYYRCDTPYHTTSFQGGLHSHNMVRYPPLALRLAQAHLCDTPFCNISRDICATSHFKKKQHKQVLVIPSLQASRDMKSISAVPLSSSQAYYLTENH